jgi:hypothetical protein
MIYKFIKMSKHEEEYRMIIMISFISGCMCIIIAVLGILCCMCNSSSLPCSQSKIKNIYTMHNVILQEENDAL